MKVTSTKTISFPSFNWGIHRGEVRDLPKNEVHAEKILSCPYITEAKETARNKPEAGGNKAVTSTK